MNGEIRINDAAQLPVILNDLRTILQMRQLDVAEASGYYKAQISTWLSGRTSMDTSSLIRVANALGYDLALVPQEEPPCPTCSGPLRETVGMVCQTCGTDYGTREEA